MSEKTKSVPTKWQDPQYFFDSETSEGHSVLFQLLQTLILDEKRERVSHAISLRVQQHSYLEHLLLTSSLLGWTGFQYISSVKDTFLGFDSPEKEQSFFEWQYHNVVGKSYDKVVKELLKTHETTKKQFKTLSSFIDLEKHSSQSERFANRLASLEEKFGTLLQVTEWPNKSSGENSKQNSLISSGPNESMSQNSQFFLKIILRYRLRGLTTMIACVAWAWTIWLWMNSQT
jgi:hypothetical protein